MVCLTPRDTLIGYLPQKAEKSVLINPLCGPLAAHLSSGVAPCLTADPIGHKAPIGLALAALHKQDLFLALLRFYCHDAGGKLAIDWNECGKGTLERLGRCHCGRLSVAVQ